MTEPTVIYPHSGRCARCLRERDDLFWHRDTGKFYCADVFRCEARYIIQGERERCVSGRCHRAANRQAFITLLSFEVLWRCDACGLETIAPRDDPPAKCQRCQHPSVFWVRSATEPRAESSQERSA